MIYKFNSLFFAALTIASPLMNEPRDIQTNITAPTDFYSFCSQFPDGIADIIYQPGGADVAFDCYTYAPDERHLFVSDMWVHAVQRNCWISLDYMRATEADFVDKIRECPRPLHQAGHPKLEYYDNSEKLRCYNEPNLNSDYVPFLIEPWIDLGCWTEGEAVNGITAWVKKYGQDCYISSEIFQDLWGVSAGSC